MQYEVELELGVTATDMVTPYCLLVLKVLLNVLGLQNLKLLPSRKIVEQNEKKKS